jgi:hypothetical protein
MLTCLHFLDFGLDQLDENGHTNSGGDAMGDGPDECITHPGGHNEMTTEGQFFTFILPYCALPHLFGGCILIACNF